MEYHELVFTEVNCLAFEFKWTIAQDKLTLLNRIISFDGELEGS